jgi:hypothetical protein
MNDGKKVLSKTSRRRKCACALRRMIVPNFVHPTKISAPSLVPSLVHMSNLQVTSHQSSESQAKKTLISCRYQDKPAD